MCSHRPGTEEASYAALEPPPDSWAAHVDELPKPGSRVLAAQNALALALIYASMDPEVRQEVDNLRDDVQELASQNENLDAYSKMMYLAACQSQQEVSKLQRQTVIHSQTAKKLVQQLEDAQTEILHANERVHSALEKRAASAAEAGELRCQLQNALDELKTAASERDADKSELKRIKMATDEGFQHNSSALAQLQAEIVRHKDEQIANHAQIQSITSQLLDVQNRGKDLETMKATLVSELDVVKTARSALAESNSRISKELLEYRDEKDALRKQLWDADSQQQALEAERNDLGTKRDALEAQTIELTDERDSLAAAHTALQRNFRDVQDERDALYGQLRDQESSRAALETECSNLRTDRDDAKAELDKLTRERNSLASAHSTLQDEHRGLKGKSDNLLHQLRDAKRQRSTLGTEYDELVAARAVLEEERNTLTAQLAASQRMCKDYDSVKNALHDAQKTAEGCKAKLRDAESQVDRLKCELGTARQVAEDGNAKHRDGESKRDALQKDLETSTEECRRLQKDLAALQKSIKDEKPLPKQYRTSTDEVKQLECQIGQLRNSVVFWKAKSQTASKALSAEQERRKALDAKIKAERAEMERTLLATGQEMEDRKRDAEEARSEREVLSRERDAVSSERDALLREKDTLIASGNACAAERDGLNIELEAARAEVEESQVKLQKEITAKVAEAAKREELESTISGLKSALLAHHQLVEDWKQEAEAAWKERAGALKERDAVIKVRGKSKTELATERDAIAAERDKLSDEYKNVVTERDSLVAERDKVVAERDEVAAELANVSEALKEAQAVHQTTVQTLATKNTLLQDKEKQINYLVPRLAQLQNQLELLEPDKELRKQLLHVATLRQSLAAARAAFREAGQEADWRRYEMGRLRKELLEETEAHAQSQIKNLDLEAKLTKLGSTTRDNARLTHKIEKLNQHVHDLRTRLDELREVRAENARLCKQMDEIDTPKRKVPR